MKKIFILVVLSIVSLMLVFAKPIVTCPITSNTNVVFYGETGFGGVGTLSKSWTIHFLDWWKQQDSRINYFELSSAQLKACNLAGYPNLKVYIQPGGDAYKQQNKLGQEGKNIITDYINSGKGYLGICAGFYYTASDYYWQDSYYNHPYLLDLYPTVEGSIREIADYDGSPGYALTPLSNGFNAIYYGGPTRGYEYTNLDYPGITKATYTALSGNMPALIKYNNMLLNSVHLEAFENDGISGLSTEQRTENYKLLANLINEVSGTNFNVPGYTNLECEDGIDNDGDNLIDLSDLGCENSQDNDESNCGDNVCEGNENWQTCSLDCLTPQCADGIDNDGDLKVDYPVDTGCLNLDDNDETDVTGPIEIFFDGFESGIGGWITTAVSGGNKWQASALNSYQGSYHAQSQPMSTTEPASVLEKGVSTLSYSNIKLSYYRKLVGLDSADEFKAKWYDGSIWQILEQKGSNSANDVSYVYKEFLLPSSASNNPGFKIRFECTAGATSEYCRVDNVNIVSN